MIDCAAREARDLPFGFARSRVSNHANVANLANLRLRQCLIQLFLVDKEMQSGHHDCVVIALRLLRLSLRLLEALLQHAFLLVLVAGGVD